MNDYIDQLIKEAEELKRDFRAGAKYGQAMYLSNPLGLALWKQHVLQVLRSFGESNPYYKDLVAVEKDCSASMPGTVFSFFLETLKKASQFPPQGLSWPIPASPATNNEEFDKKEEQKISCKPEPENNSELVPSLSSQTTKESPSEETPKTEKGASNIGAAAQSKIGITQQEEMPPQKQFHELDTEAREVYGLLIAGAREFITQPDKSHTTTYEAISGLCVLTLEVLKKNPALITCATFSSSDNYLYAHAANVTILSQAIALDYGLSKEDMILLSFCAMANDLGMTGFQELYTKRAYLNDSEFYKITRHVEAGIAKLELITGMNPHLKERAKIIIRQAHERVDGSGYPLKLSGKEIDLLAQIIGVADIYEAMTHPRAWREDCHPHEVIRQFIEEGQQKHNAKVIKSLVSALSLYPPFSLVALSSGEIARVLKPIRGSLTKPLVEILLDEDFTPVKNHILNLKECPIHHAIDRPVLQSELKERNPEFAAQLESSRWWEKSAADKAGSLG